MGNLIKDFLDKKNVFAVVGVSEDKTKYGRKVFDFLKMSGFKVYPINPNVDFILGDKCYPSLKDLSIKIDVVSFVVPFEVTEKVIFECKDLGIKKVWFQPGSESDKVIKFCKDNKIKCVYNQCLILSILKR